MKRGDGFSAEFLLEKKCDVNLTTKESLDTALHYICTFSEKTSDPETFKEMLAVGTKLLEIKCNVNKQNVKG